MTASELALAICEAAADKKARDIVELDLRGVLGYTDYFVIASGSTDRQTRAIHDGVMQTLKHDHGLLPRRVAGVAEGRWILLDYLDVVVHIFTPQTREFYRLERLWGEAPVRSHAHAQAPDADDPSWVAGADPSWVQPASPVAGEFDVV